MYNLLKIKNLLKKEGMTVKGAKTKIKNFKIDTKTSIDILPTLKEILKELKKYFGEKYEKNCYRS